VPKATEDILNRLKEVGFEAQAGGATPFGEELPLVTGVAWEKRTAQLALIAESTDPIDDVVWQQLLFAGSGIRHHLSGDGPSAFGTPVIFAVVELEAGRQIKALVERLARDFAVFNRVDVNIVPRDHLNGADDLDDALAPLLPRCRSLLGKEISRQEVQRFWAELRANVETAAEELDPSFSAMREAAGRDAADALIGESGEAEDLPSPAPLRKMALRNFRSIEKMDLDLWDVNVIHGPNGGGKTSVVEAMELCWAGTSQRKPGDVRAAEYERHLPSNGDGEFSIEIDGRVVNRVSERPTAELGRCVLTHEAMTTLVSEDPKSRFAGLLSITGLEVPDLDRRTKELVDVAKSTANDVLVEAGIAPLKHARVRSLEHLKDALGSEFLQTLLELPDLAMLEKTVASVSGGAYKPRQWSAEEGLRKELGDADTAVLEAGGDRIGEAEVARRLDKAAGTVDALLSARLQAAGVTNRLLRSIEQSAVQPTSEQMKEAHTELEAEAPIPVELAARWLNHARGMDQAAQRFRRDADEIGDGEWLGRLTKYADALDSAWKAAPERELERLSQPRQSSRPPRQETGVEQTVWAEAGFGTVPSDPVATAGPLRELCDALQLHSDTLRDVRDQLREHPARSFNLHREAVMDALCRFELAKGLRRGGPILHTSELMVAELLDNRLAPVVRELVTAIVRFEWYFKPLRMSTGKKAVVFGGLATDREDLDARMLLNSAERTVLGVAWFLALHMLQPKERRRVLILDDPTSGFDNANQAGFGSTLRAFVRLLEPEQVVVTTHDDAVAAVLSEELSVVDGWPGSVARLRFQRGRKDVSEVSIEDRSETRLELEPEIQQLGLPADAVASG
jgi:hypothetical protein